MNFLLTVLVLPDTTNNPPPLQPALTGCQRGAHTILLVYTRLSVSLSHSKWFPFDHGCQGSIFIQGIGHGLTTILVYHGEKKALIFPMFIYIAWPSIRSLLSGNRSGRISWLFDSCLGTSQLYTFRFARPRKIINIEKIVRFTMCNPVTHNFRARSSEILFLCDSRFTQRFQERNLAYN